MRDSLIEAIRQHVAVPAHIAEAAQACASDLLSGPKYARLPESGDWKDFGEDDWSSLADDLEGDVTQVYTGPVGDILRTFIDDLPGTLYANEDQDDVFDEEPEGYEEDGEFYEAALYYEVGRDQIVEALFGRTIAREFR